MTPKQREHTKRSRRLAVVGIAAALVAIVPGAAAGGGDAGRIIATFSLTVEKAAELVGAGLLGPEQLVPGPGCVPNDVPDAFAADVEPCLLEVVGPLPNLPPFAGRASGDVKFEFGLFQFNEPCDAFGSFECEAYLKVRGEVEEGQFLTYELWCEDQSVEGGQCNQSFSESEAYASSAPSVKMFDSDFDADDQMDIKNGNAKTVFVDMDAAADQWHSTDQGCLLQSNGAWCTFIGDNEDDQCNIVNEQEVCDDGDDAQIEFRMSWDNPNRHVALLLE